MPYLAATTGFNLGAAFALILIPIVALWIAPMIAGYYAWQAGGRNKGEAEGLFFAACLSWFGVMIALTLRDRSSVAMAVAAPSPLIPPATSPETLKKAV